MPKFRNDGDGDRHVLGFSFPGKGQDVVEVSDDLDPHKLAFLRKHFTEVLDEPETEPDLPPAATEGLEEGLPMSEDKPEPKKKKTTRRKRSPFRS